MHIKLEKRNMAEFCPKPNSRCRHIQFLTGLMMMMMVSLGIIWFRLEVHTCMCTHTRYVLKPGLFNQQTNDDDDDDDEKRSLKEKREPKKHPSSNKRLTLSACTYLPLNSPHAIQNVCPSIQISIYAVAPPPKLQPTWLLLKKCSPNVPNLSRKLVR